MAPPYELRQIMFSLGRCFALSIAVALMLALTAPAVSAAAPLSPSQQQEPEQPPAPSGPQGVVIVTPTAPDDPAASPDPQETPDPPPADATPEPTDEPVEVPGEEPAGEPAEEPTQEPAPAPPPAPPAGEAGQYRVERGDTLYSIARSHGVTVADLQEANGLEGTAIQAGQTLIVPTGPSSVRPTATPTPAAQATATPTDAEPTSTALPLDRPTTTTKVGPTPSAATPAPSDDDIPEEFDLRAMAEKYTEQFLRWIEPLITGVSPFVFVGALVGMVNSCLFYLVLGRSLKLFIPFLLIGAAAAVVGVTVSRQLPESGPMIGEVDLIAASVATWLILLIARSFRL